MTRRAGWGMSVACGESRHGSCTGCTTCTCHHRRAPVNLREIVRRGRERASGPVEHAPTPAPVRPHLDPDPVVEARFRAWEALTADDIAAGRTPDTARGGSR